MVIRKLLIIFVLALSIFAFIACESEGPAEKAGKEVDKAFDSAKQKLNEVTK